MRVFAFASASLLASVLCAQPPSGDLQHFVRVSPRDVRYFELDNGAPYIPIGLNLIAPPKGDPALMDEWFGKLAAQGGNYVRILSLIHI